VWKSEETKNERKNINTDGQKTKRMIETQINRYKHRKKDRQKERNTFKLKN
jgi:hypothetical protein